MGTGSSLEVLMGMLREDEDCVRSFEGSVSRSSFKDLKGTCLADAFSYMYHANGAGGGARTSGLVPGVSGLKWKSRSDGWGRAS